MENNIAVGGQTDWKPESLCNFAESCSPLTFFGVFDVSLFNQTLWRITYCHPIRAIPRYRSPYSIWLLLEVLLVHPTSNHLLAEPVKTAADIDYRRSALQL